MRMRSTALILTALVAAGTALADAPTRSLYIVQSKSADAASQRLRSAGVEAERELDVINAVAAYLTPEQLAALRADSNVRVFDDREVSPRGGLFDSLGGVLGSNSLIKLTQQVTTPIVSPVLQSYLTSSLTSPLVKQLSAQQQLQDGKGLNTLGLLYETNYPALIGADSLHSAGITGKGVTIAVLDTGFWQDVSQNYGNRVLASVDVTNGNRPIAGDPYGHGTHVTAIAASGAQALNGSYSGIAPSANLVLVRAFNGQGAGRYTDVIAGVNWIVANRDKYKIRVLNLSFGASPQSYYWDDPLLSLIHI
ncbi:S8 family serine peptidase [Steroidobacter cummioxidans]|uniref:S8 family serine peptidase n=1 Tax=Steroidobacter cummioxidans TaxID=1803913 RepID=UPI000E30BF8B|nr:S8 family serine peptidase [Steroidobacter cummioxidans]